MKYRTTQKEIKNNFGLVYKVGYCELQNLFNYTNAESYTCGVYGWNADIYSYGGTAIVTGYRPFGKPLPREIYKPFEQKAEKIIYGDSVAWDKKKEELDKLVIEFFRAVWDFDRTNK